VTSAAPYERIINNSEKVAWSLDEVLPSSQKLDFTKKLLPDSLVLASGQIGHSLRTEALLRGARMDG
jgi:hypothetical protein